MKRALVVVVLVVATLVASAAPASAHGVGGLNPTNYLTTIDTMSPHVDGLTLTVVDLGTRLQLTNTTSHDVVVLGYDKEPYLRVGPRGAFENTRSPATYLNKSLKLAATPVVPKSADPTAPPEWRKVGSGNTVRWHDHSAHYMGTDDPPVVQRDRSHRHVIDRYTVAMEWHGESVVAKGRIIWVPPPSPWPFVAIAVVLAAALVWASRTKAWAKVFAGALVVLIVVETLHVVGLWDASTDGAGKKLFGNAYSIGGILLSLLALWWMRRKGAESAVPLVLVASIFLFVAGGLGDVTSLAHSQIATTFAPAFARLLVTVTLGVGLGLAIAAAWRMRSANLAPPAPPARARQDRTGGTPATS
jgi:hypothetical protein